jgi:hypothetical protein
MAATMEISPVQALCSDATAELWPSYHESAADVKLAQAELSEAGGVGAAVSSHTVVKVCMLGRSSTFTLTRGAAVRSHSATSVAGVGAESMMLS